MALAPCTGARPSGLRVRCGATALGAENGFARNNAKANARTIGHDSESTKAGWAAGSAVVYN